jgi:hypothetical protein
MLAAPGGGGGAFDGISEAVSGIVAASDSGFMVSENGGQPLLDAIDELAREVSEALTRSSVLGRHLPLGSTPNAKIFAPFIATVATDPVQGAIPVLTKLQKDLEAAHTAIQKAIDNYNAAEQENASDIKVSGTLT